MTSKDRTQKEGTETKTGPTFVKKSKEILGTNVDLSFKPIHQQVQEENEKTKQYANKSAKQLLPDLDIDEKLLNLLSKELYKLV